MDRCDSGSARECRWKLPGRRRRSRCLCRTLRPSHGSPVFAQPTTVRLSSRRRLTSSDSLVLPSRPQPMAPLAEMTANGQDEALLNEGPSLQDAFKQFRMRKRQQQRQVPTKELRAKAAARREKDPAGDKARLREKFIAKCMENIGIPYAQRYHKPGDELYGKEYLDCCALFRKALRQLRPDFGFDVGPWNQAYLFATLPRKLEFSEVKPGDLLFVEGTYFKGRKKQQKGNIVHVEMFLGEELGSGPESTLASRDHWGCVSIQNSFKYVSPWYEITALHWRSLDDWLEGRCEPVAMPDCFTGHDPYGEKEQRVGKKSVFDEGADDVDDEAIAAAAAKLKV